MAEREKDRHTDTHRAPFGARLRTYVMALLALYGIYAATAVLLLDQIIYPFDQTSFTHPGGRLETVSAEIPVTIFDAGNDAEVVFYLQGNIASRGNFIDEIMSYRAAGYTVVTMKWAGSEGRSGPVSEERLKDEALAVMRDIPSLTRQTSPSVHIIGYSMGSGIAAYVASRSNPTTLTLQAGFSSLCEIMTTRAKLPACWLPSVDRWDNRPYLDKIKAPVLILHGLADDLIPPEYSRRLAHGLLDAGNPPQVETYEAVGHNDFWHSDNTQRIQHFIAGGYATDPPVQEADIDPLFSQRPRESTH